MAKEKQLKALAIVKVKKMPAPELKEYAEILSELKERISAAQLKAAISVNRELILLYWQIGSSLLKKQEGSGWGSKIVEKLSKDLKESFPDIEGFSPRNIRFMIQFAREYQDNEIVKQLVSQIPWGHNIFLLQKLNTVDERIWYAKKTIENGWSRSILLHWIENKLHKRQGKALTNFKKTLTPNQSDLAHETLKDPYNFDFLTLRKNFDEKELENGLIEHVRKFLMELGSGFAFVGQQYPLEVSGKNYKIDLLLYNFKLRRFFVVEIKARAFDPKDTGQTNFYLSAVDDLLKHPEDQPTIGLILCKTKDNITAEYALRNLKSPIGVAGYEVKLVESLPKELKRSLPTIQEIEQELEGTRNDNRSKNK
jgi:predicted nuclease of restriction endonuclease-like (RecB) superfamily